MTSLHFKAGTHLFQVSIFMTSAAFSDQQSRLLRCSQPLIRSPGQHLYLLQRTHYLSKLIRWWCMPPAFPRPPGCFLCFPADTKHPPASRLLLAGAPNVHEPKLTDATVSVAHMSSELPGLGLLGGLSEMTSVHVINTEDPHSFHHIPRS